MSAGVTFDIIWEMQFENESISPDTVAKINTVEFGSSCKGIKVFFLPCSSIDEKASVTIRKNSMR